MNKVFIALALLVVTAAAFFLGISNAQTVPTICGFLAWTPVVWFVGWSMSSAARGRKIRFVVAPQEQVVQVPNSNNVRQAREREQRERSSRLQQQTPVPEYVEYDESDDLARVRRGEKPSWAE